MRCPVPGIWYPCLKGLMSTTNSIPASAPRVVKNETPFEPDPQNVRLLRRSVRANLFRQVRVEPAAVGDSTATLELFRSDINPTDHRAYDAGDRRSSVRVRSFALDDYFHPGQRIDVVKLDIQGFEMKALTGMRRILWNQREHIVLLTEFTPAALHDCVHSGFLPR